MGMSNKLAIEIVSNSMKLNKELLKSCGGKDSLLESLIKSQELSIKALDVVDRIKYDNIIKITDRYLGHTGNSDLCASRIISELKGGEYGIN